MPQLQRIPSPVTVLVIVLSLTTARASSISSRPALHASRALHASIPLQQMFSHSPDLASLTDLFPRGPDGENNELDNTDPKLLTKAPVPPKFNINTFTFNKKNIRKPGDIFSLLADVEEAKPTKNDKSSQMKQKVEAFSGSSDKKTDTTKFKLPGVDLANVFGKNILLAAKDLEDLLAVVQQMKKKVESKMGNSSIPSESTVITSNTTAHLVNILLNTTKLEEIRTASLTAKTEDEFLDHLAEVLAGAETRHGGSALTLDPVTIIALLTLAAYLIRAVYQILTVTGRSLDASDLTLPLQLSDLPDAMVVIHNWISDSQFTHVREERSLPYVTTILDIPGNLAAIIKLHREGHQPCVRQFLCEQLQDRTFPEVTLTDLFIAGVGYLLGDSDLGSYIDSALARSSSPSCAMVPDGCSPRTLSDAHYLEDLYTRASYKFFNLLAMMTGLL